MKYIWILLILTSFDCWTVYESCRRGQHVKNFTQYMTGPSGELIVVVLLPGNKMKRIKITPQQLWFSDTLDYDKDGDIDLKDWHLTMIDN